MRSNHRHQLMTVPVVADMLFRSKPLHVRDQSWHISKRKHITHTPFLSLSRAAPVSSLASVQPLILPVLPNGDQITKVSFVGCPKYKSSLAQSLYITGLRPIELSLPLANSPDHNNTILCPCRHSAQTKISTGICTRAEVMMYFSLHKVVTTASPDKPQENSANGYR